MWPLVVLAGILSVGSFFFILQSGGDSEALGTVGEPEGTQTYEETSARHVSTKVDYPRAPSTGGDHSPAWQTCGVYFDEIEEERATHSMEHGAVWVTYQPSLPLEETLMIEEIVTTNYVGEQRYVLLSPYPENPAPVVASAWGKQIQIEEVSDPRLSQFINAFAGGSQAPEQGGPC